MTEQTTTTPDHDTDTEETPDDAARRLAAELADANQRIATMRRIAADAAILARDIANGTVHDDLGPTRRQPQAGASVPVPRAQEQDIPADQLAALIAGMPEPDHGWTLLQMDLIRETARQAYRVGYAAALGYPVTVGEHGDQLLIGDRPAAAEDQGDEQVPPKPGKFCKRHFSWLCQAGQGQCATEQPAAENQADGAEPEQRQRRRIQLAPRVRAALDAQETAGSES